MTGASVADQAVLTGNASQRTVRVQGYEPQLGENMNPWTLEVGPGYLATLGIPLVAGRDFTDRDVMGAPDVAIVNETFARYYFGDENPIGRRFGFSAQNDPARMEIVGVVKDTQYSQVRPGEAELARSTSGETGVPRVVYTPYQQSQELGEMTVYLRATPAAAGALPALARQAVQRADRTLPVFGMTTMAATVDDSLAVERMLAVLSTLFGALATTLAAVGLYGLMSYSVARRTREIGIRIALGAGAAGRARPGAARRGDPDRDRDRRRPARRVCDRPGRAVAALRAVAARSVVARPGRRGPGRREPGRRLPSGPPGGGNAAAAGAAHRIVVAGSVTVTIAGVAGSCRVRPILQRNAVVIGDRPRYNLGHVERRTACRRRWLS